MPDLETRLVVDAEADELRARHRPMPPALAPEADALHGLIQQRLLDLATKALEQLMQASAFESPGSRHDGSKPKSVVRRIA
jgi:hypothetical protein